ncbi:hypothetical protein ABT352_33140 [Streptosporangium sp. NPDC000563]|uniref:hypothetical protein n=1 Tax=Streptosporangium sp. NPDC000563 TaxID=3154366 RepID=UPI0033269016
MGRLWKLFQEAEQRAGIAEKALAKVAELAAQHLADTKPRQGRSPVLGALAGGPAVAHFAELVLAITGPPPARVGEERVEYVEMWPFPAGTWAAVLAEVQRRSAPLHGLLALHCVSHSVIEAPHQGLAYDQQGLMLHFDHKDARDRFAEMKGWEVLETALTHVVGGGEWRIASDWGAPSGTPEAAPVEDARKWGDVMQGAEWTQIVHLVKKRRPFLGYLLERRCTAADVDIATAADVVEQLPDERTIRITFDTPSAEAQFSEFAGHRLLAEVHREVVGGQWKVEFRAAPEPPQSSPEPAPVEDAEDRRPQGIFTDLCWSPVIAEVRRRSAPLHDLLVEDCRSYSVMDGPHGGEKTMAFGFVRREERSRFFDLDGREILESVLADVVGGLWSVPDLRPPAEPPPSSTAETPPSTAPNTWLTALDLVRQREPLVWDFIARYCVGMTVDAGAFPGFDTPKLMLTFAHDNIVIPFSQRLVIRPDKVQEYWRVLGEALTEITGQQWLLNNTVTGSKAAASLAAEAPEHNLHTEGLGKDVLEVLKTAQNLARIDPTATAADLAALLAKLYPQAEADAPPAATHVTSPGAWLAALDILRRREQDVWSFLIRRCAGVAVEKAEDDRPRLVATFDGPALADRFLTLTHEGRRYATILVEALNQVTGEDWWVAADPGTPVPAVPLVDAAAVEERVRADIAARLRAERQDCDNHPWSGWGASCWTCGRNGILDRAESIALGQWNPPAGKEALGEVPEYGTDAHRWWLAGIRRSHQLRANTIGDDALAALETAEDLARRSPAMTAADLVAELAALYPQPAPEPAPNMAEVLADAPNRPHVVAAPWLNFGRPTLARTWADTLAVIGPYLAGDAPETVLAELGITRGDFLTVCWWEAHWGTRRQEWGDWATQHAGALREGHWRGFDDVPYPPRPGTGGQEPDSEPSPAPGGDSTPPRLLAALKTDTRSPEGMVDEGWQTILDTLRLRSEPLWLMLTRHCVEISAKMSVFDFDEHTMRIVLRHDSPADLFLFHVKEDPGYVTPLTQTLSKVVGGRWRVSFEVAPGNEPDELNDDSDTDPAEEQAVTPCPYLAPANRWGSVISLD